MKVVTIFIQNNNGKYLIQKRSQKKTGKYGITSGHINLNEESKQGAIREIKEELGLDIRENELKLFYNNKIDSNEYNLYFLKKDIDINKLTLQKEEVDEVKWCTEKEIQDLIENKQFYEIQLEALDIFKKYIYGGKQICQL